MPTNFEKWRDSLTPEIFDVWNEDGCNQIQLKTVECPALTYCINEMDPCLTCKETLLNWANKEAE